MPKTMTKIVAEQEEARPIRSRAGRGRPSLPRVAAIEANILSAAREVFLEHGFSGASMDRVAQLAQVSKSTLYARYPDKTKLFEAVARDRLKAWWIDPEPMPADVPVAERLLRRGVAMLRSLQVPEVGAFTLLMASEMARFPHLGQLFKEDGYNVLIALVADDLRTAAELGNWTITDPVGVAQSFIAAVQGWHISRDPSDLPTDDESVAYVSRLVTIFLTGRAGW